jgi:hypothetical protein
MAGFVPNVTTELAAAGDSTGNAAIPTIVTERVANAASPFPKPCITICVLRRVEVVITGDDGSRSVEIVTALESERAPNRGGGATEADANGNGSVPVVVSGAAGSPHPYIDTAEFDSYAYPTISSQTTHSDGSPAPVYCHYYELTRDIKDTIFGQVHHGLILMPNPEGDGRFVRIRPYREVAVKVYFKTRLRSLRGRTHENPLAEIAAMQ